MIAGHREIEQGIRSLNLQTETALDPEFVRALRTCDSAAALEVPLTFPSAELSPAAWIAQWQEWLAGIFAGALAPALLAATRHAHAGQFRELVTADLALTASLGAETISRSTAGGRKLLKRISGARGVRWLDRLQAAAEAGATPGHFAVAYGCQGALFHQSPRLTLATYTYWEWSAAVVAGRQPRAGTVAAFQAASAGELQRITDELLSSPSLSAAAPSRAFP